MHKRRCNSCRQWNPVSEWDYGCPACGYSHALGDYVRLSEFPGVQVMPDIKPYQSMADGSIVNSRSSHREMLKRTGTREIGNELKYLSTPPQRPDVEPRQRKELIIAQIHAFGGETNLRKAVRKEVEHIRWNSRKD